jgi:hypothetical protein
MNESELTNIVYQLKDYEAVADALQELDKLNSLKCMGLCSEIILSKKGDVYLQAYAYDLLYLRDPEKAILLVKRKLADCDLYLLGTILDKITMDSSIVDEKPILKNFVNELKNFLKSSSAVILILWNLWAVTDLRVILVQ